MSEEDVARWAAHAGLTVPADRLAVVAAGVDYFRSVVAVLHELDLGDVPPATASRAGEDADAAL